MNGRTEFRDTILLQGLGLHVSIIDDILDTDLPILYSGCDVYVQPSYWEGFGFPVLEAMACGAPVVSTNAGALPEVVGEAGLLVEARDSIALATGIESVLLEPERAHDMSERGLRRARKFTWIRTAQLTEESYRRTLHSNSEKRTGANHDQLV